MKLIDWRASPDKAHRRFYWRAWQQGSVRQRKERLHFLYGKRALPMSSPTQCLSCRWSRGDGDWMLTATAGRLSGFLGVADGLCAQSIFTIRLARRRAGQHTLRGI